MTAVEAIVVGRGIATTAGTHAPPAVPHSRPWITADDQQAVAAALAEGMLATGRRAEALAEALAARVALPYGVLAASGTQALEFALRGLGIGRGDAVVVPTYACGEVAHAVRRTGARVRLADVDRRGLLTGDRARAAMDAATAAVIVVHVFGQAADDPSLRTLGVPVVDDACQALGLPLPAGDVVVSSLHATKCICAGEGGHVAVRDPELARRLAAVGAGTFPDLAAALALSQLGRYDAMLRRRRVIAQRLGRLATSLAIDLVTPVDDGFPPFRVVVRAPEGFDAAARAFAAAGVTVRSGVDALLHREAGLPDAAFPEAVRLLRDAVSLPAHASLTDEELDRVEAAMRAVWGNR